MSTIPTTFNENVGAYNITGGKTNGDESSENFFSVFILNRTGSIISDTIFENVLSLNFKSVFAILNNTQAINIDFLSEKYPSIKFIRPLEKITAGEMINICANECTSKFFIVLWSDTIIVSQGFITTMLDQLFQDNKICTAPMLLNSKNESIPNQILPTIDSKKNFSTQKLYTIKSNTKTTYPVDFIGIYNREKFIELTGFDHTIKNNYWQLLDFSLRSFLWGNTISIATSFRVRYLADVAVEDTSIDASYRKFFLKNLAPSIKVVNEKNEAYVPNTVFFSYLKSSGENIFKSLKRFKKAKSWVAITKDRFKISTLDLVSTWEPNL